MPQRTPPASVAAYASLPISRSGPSAIARTLPTRRPEPASTPLSMSTARAPVRRAMSSRSSGSSITCSAAQTVATLAPGTLSGAPSHKTCPLESTIRSAVTTVPGSIPGTRAPARPKLTICPGGGPSVARSPTRAARAPALRATRSSDESAHASVRFALTRLPDSLLQRPGETANRFLETVCGRNRGGWFEP